MSAMIELILVYVITKAWADDEFLCWGKRKSRILHLEPTIRIELEVKRIMKWNLDNNNTLNNRNSLPTLSTQVSVHTRIYCTAHEPL